MENSHFDSFFLIFENFNFLIFLKGLASNVQINHDIENANSPATAPKT